MFRMFGTSHRYSGLFFKNTEMRIAMKYDLICTDIDGTLLNDDKKLLPQVKQSLRDAAAQGIQVVLVSGRMPSGVEVIEKELQLQCVKICNAGSYILLGEKCICAEYMPSRVMRNMYKMVAEKRNIPLWIFREKEWYVTGMDEYIEKEQVFVSYIPRLVDVEELAAQWDKEGKGPNKLLVAADPETIQEIHREMREQKEQLWPDIDMARSADTFLEIFPKGVNKGTALAAVCRELGMSRERAIAFGDHELDIPLIEAAGTGVAMGNAIEQLKEKADYVTKSNNEAGIACALEHFLTI